MLFIRSFPNNLVQTEALAEWLQEVAVAVETIPYHKLRFVIHEAFVNACKYGHDHNANIVVVIRKHEDLEITITDPGNGFEIPNALSPFDAGAIGLSWNLARDRDTNVIAELRAPNTLSFSLRQEKGHQEVELMENHRGLISILKAAKNLSYHFVPNSFNYLHITC